MNIIYYISNGENQEGPFTKAELADKHITRTTLVWREGFEKWLPISNVKELSELWDNLAESSAELPPPLSESTERGDIDVRNIGQQENGRSVRSEEVNKKHGIPALISFFLPGVGQLIKGHIGKAFLIWGLFIGALLLVLRVAVLIDNGLDSYKLVMIIGIAAFPIIFFWNVYDAYNSN